MDNSQQNAAGPRKNRGYPFILAGIIGVGVILIVQSSFSSGTYNLDIAAIQERPQRYLGRELKVVGNVVDGTINLQQTAGTISTQFVIEDGKGQTIPIIYPHNPPDPFKEGREVIVEGVLEKNPGGRGQSAHRVLCEKLTVKCPSKYQEEGLEGPGNSEDYYRKKYGGEAEDWAK